MMAGPWLADPRVDGKGFENDKTSKLKGIGAKSEETLSKNGITTIKALRDISPEKSKAISDAARGEAQISNSQLTKFKTLAKHAEPGDPPEKVDYRKFDNLYKERLLVPRVPYESRGTQAALTKEPLHSGNSANSNSLPHYHNSSKLLLVTPVSP
jgi:hypothetical protein